MKRAVDYAHLIGKYIRMEMDGYDDQGGFVSGKHGMEALVVAVWDVTTSDGKRAVEICGDYGMGYTIREHEEHDWHFAIADSESNMHSLSKWGSLPQTFGQSQKANIP